MFQNYIKTALRNISRNSIYAAINISGLSLGLACVMLIMLYIKDEVSYDRFHRNASHIYRIFSEAKSPNGEIRRMGITGDIQGPRFKAKIPEIREFARLQGGYGDIKKGTEITQPVLLHADSNFFSIFSFPLLRGNPKTALLESHSIVLSEDAAKKYFGSTDVLGKTVDLKTSEIFEPYTVTGITERCPQNSSIQFDVLLPLHADPEMEQNAKGWNSFFLNTYVLLNPGTDFKKVESKMTNVFLEDQAVELKKFEEQSHTKFNGGYLLQPFLDIHLNNDMDRNDISGASNRIYSYILTGIALFILIIACINFINLTMARSMKRAKEIGIRKVVGGTRKQLIIQFLGESFVLCLIAFILAIVLVELFLPLFNRLSNKALELSYLVDLKLIASYFGLFMLTGLLSGFYPALVLSGYNPVQSLYKKFNIAGKNYLQKSLVVLQFATASFLITATLIIFYQFTFLTTENLGYDDSNIIQINKQSLKRNEAILVKEELLKNPNISGVALKDDGYSFNGAKINGDSGIAFANANIDASFLPLLKIPVIKGRNFSNVFPSDSAHAALVNEQFVQKAGWKDPIGEKISFGEKETYTVVGVVKDYHYLPLNQKIEPELFTMGMNQDSWTVYIKIKPTTETLSLRYIEKTFKRLFPESPFSFVFKDQENVKNYESEARWKQIVLFGAILTIFISCIGMFGLSVLSTERRTKEIGVRKVLGASVREVAIILSKDFLNLVIISLIVAIPLSFFVGNKWLENYPYRIQLSWWMFSIVAILVILIAIVTVSFQSIKAAAANPVKSLRTE
jgi:putative ABC transport system permease protein